MGAFRYQAVEASGSAINGVIEADDRKAALQTLSARGIFASEIEAMADVRGPSPRPSPAGRGDTANATGIETQSFGARAGFGIGGGIRRKQVTAFTRELAA